MLKEFRYPVELTQDGDQVIARVIDVPEALTFGDDREHALHEAEDALVVALSGYIDSRKPIPVPARSGIRQPAVVLTPLVAAKVALYNAMLESKTSNVALAKKLGVTETVIRRLLNLDHRSHIGQIEQALELLGLRLITSVADVA
ncbi:MAG: type II toxin-antitoxin system HicB family antitoxin [Gammaproteobacteria bacterium]|nr:type II toxin-antitoxin system HicB family antitoxin [Gammaproteobacteria bacterium]